MRHRLCSALRRDSSPDPRAWHGPPSPSALPLPPSPAAPSPSPPAVYLLLPVVLPLVPVHAAACYLPPAGARRLSPAVARAHGGVPPISQRARRWAGRRRRASGRCSSLRSCRRCGKQHLSSTALPFCVCRRLSLRFRLSPCVSRRLKGASSVAPLGRRPRAAGRRRRSSWPEPRRAARWCSRREG